MGLAKGRSYGGVIMLNRITTIGLAVVFGLLVGAVACDGPPTKPPPPTFSLSGRVTAEGVALVGVDVEVTSGLGTVKQVTDMEGRYLARVAKGPVTVRVQKDGFTSDGRQFIVDRDEQVDFVLQRLGIPKAKLEMLWWVNEGPTPACAPNGDCQWSDLLQNTGTGCASGTTVVIHLSSGADYPLDAVGGGLAEKIIQPNEIVGLLSVQYVDSRHLAYPNTYTTDVKWNDVPCSAG